MSHQAALVSPAIKVTPSVTPECKTQDTTSDHCLEAAHLGRYLRQSPTFKNYCPQRAAEKIYLDLVADLQLYRFNLSKSFRDAFSDAFAAVCPNETHHWMSYYVRCQARLGLKVDRNFNVVCLATLSATSKPARKKSC